MLKLSNVQITQKTTLTKELTNAKATLETAVESYNDAINTAYKDFEEKVTEFNNALEKASDFVEGVVDDIRDRLDSMADSKKESIEGIAYGVWLKTWEEVLVSDSLRDYLDFTTPTESDMPTNEFDDFESLPEEPE